MIKLRRLLLFLLGLRFVDETYSTSNDFLIKRDSVNITNGDKNCITNCSGMSARNNVFMDCSVDVCKGELETAEHTSQRPEINPMKDIFLQKYDDGGKDKLALYVRWSPVDNVSLRYTKGYLINITDEHSDYSACYHFKTPMSFSNNAEDEYYNDCFGKAGGTRIIPGSVITVRITSFPLWHRDPNDGTTVGRIEVPDCDNSMMHSLLECQVPGGRPMTKACSSATCDTVSEIGGKRYPVSCEVNSAQCDKTNKSHTGGTSKPIHVSQAQEWYKYIDPVTKDVKLALNFSWMPPNDSSIANLHYFHLEIIPAHVSSLHIYDKCFSIHTELIQDKHKNANFFFDCYGRGDSSAVRPGGQYHIYLESQPKGVEDNAMLFQIVVPDCDDEAMDEVTACTDESRDDARLEVVEIFCHNLSVKVNYSLTGGSEHNATMRICEAGIGLFSCNSWVATHDDLPASGVFNAAVTSSVNQQANFSIMMYQQNDRFRRIIGFFDFSECAVSFTTSNVAVSVTTSSNEPRLVMDMLISTLLFVIGIWSIFRSM